jgi:hypothetical protein
MLYFYHCIIKMYEYYLVHGTKSVDSLINILKTGFIKPGKDVALKYFLPR